RAPMARAPAVAAGHSPPANTAARHAPPPLEHELGEPARIRCAREEPAGRRPATLRRGDLGGALPGETARPAPLRRSRLVATTRAERSPGVVGDLASPHEIPQRG